MTSQEPFEIFLVAPPGLEAVLAAEVAARGFPDPVVTPGGVLIQGGWPEVWRANLEIRGASRVLARVASFRAFHLAQLDKRARRVAWGTFLRPDVPVRVEATCKGSRIYHAGAAAQRIGRAITEELGAPLKDDAPLCLKARLDDDLCTVSIDTSGEPLHRRLHKEAVAKAPLRETLAALFLRLAGYDGQEPLVDPMCGSGTFVIEAAEIAAGLAPGRSRPFAFQQLASFDPVIWKSLRAAPLPPPPSPRFFGSDRDAGAIRMSQANAARAGVGDCTRFHQAPVSALEPPEGPPGLVMVNPPYGARIGDRKKLHALYHALGQTLNARFSGWRVGLVTNDPALVAATGLPFGPPAAVVSHGGLGVSLSVSRPLA
ncbi:THUMP domain-containing class I SAM-dependent RNA methyltransferase [Pararhodospirillum oryzae]|uniref:RNA methyltransferase n=1 Tax=Pararhodospirillum oryzae TaxID=478448 RepID=A0A512HAL0_9PROT|nr:class I SAM-dependent RNA methyltransferase [Pararhodospirillum oryzae]GEO82491.1 RNA methyltransferase [Pararhodospirillum oryzae]